MPMRSSSSGWPIAAIVTVPFAGRIVFNSTMAYRMYIDEVGNSDLKSSDDPNHRFLSLTGVIIDLRHVAEVVQPDMEAIKSRFFKSHPDDPVIFHRKDMVNRRRSFVALRDDQVRAAFDDELIGLLRQWQYTVISVCLDKKRHRDTYRVWTYDPYHYCLAVLLERCVYFLNRRGAQGDVMAESRGGKEDVRLKGSFERLFARGTDYLDAPQLAAALRSRQLKVKQKTNNIAGLQLADLIAHPSRNEILRENGHPAPLAPFATRVVDVLATKYDEPGGRAVGKKML